jgi:hypothetical protein
MFTDDGAGLAATVVGGAGATVVDGVDATVVGVEATVVGGAGATVVVVAPASAPLEPAAPVVAAPESALAGRAHSSRTSPRARNASATSLAGRTPSVLTLVAMCSRNRLRSVPIPRAVRERAPRRRRSG